LDFSTLKFWVSAREASSKAALAQWAKFQRAEIALAVENGTSAQRRRKHRQRSHDTTGTNA